MAQSNLSILEKTQEAVGSLTNRLPQSLQRPLVAIVCGSGLSGLADTIQADPRVEYDYASIPHFPQPTGMVVVRLKESDTNDLSCWTCGQAGFRALGTGYPRSIHGRSSPVSRCRHYHPDITRPTLMHIPATTKATRWTKSRFPFAYSNCSVLIPSCVRSTNGPI